jgi:ribonucleoside-diphosphate reductase alpha chain
MHKRLAREFARIESKYPNPMSEDDIFDYLDQFKYIIPQGSPMAGIGNPFRVMSISNCFVIQSPYDSYGGILKTDQEQAQIMKRRGGVGFDISTIRPRGLPTANAAQTTDGIGVFMERFSNTCREVAQGGRRGALMLTLSVHHPEIRTFIHIKEDLKKVTGANISIRLSDEFMTAVKNKEKVQLRFPVDSKEPTILEMVDAEELWTEIIAAAHKSAEPGLLFWDTVMKYCPANCYPEFITISTNPCGEITLSAYDSCRLLLINVLSFVKNPFLNPEMDWRKYTEVIRVAQRLMDDVVDLELECIDKIIQKIKDDPEPEEVKLIELNLWNKIKTACINGRRTGLGLTGVGDLVAAMNMRYGSNESIKFVEELYQTLALNSYKSSVQMAKERGAFPSYSYAIEHEHPFIKRIMSADQSLQEEYIKFGRRNIANLTTPPAGSTSMLAKSILGYGVSSGIENVLYIRSIRRKKINPNDKDAQVDFVDEMGDKWTEFPVYHNGFESWKQITGKTDDQIKESPYWNSTADDVDWVAKVDMQGVAQKWIDHSISNTTNLPEEVDIETVKNVYMRGWEQGCKGITIYRKNSRAGVVLDNSANKKETKKVSFNENHAPKRPHELDCDVYHSTIQGEKWTIFVGKLEGRPYELMGGLAKFVNLPKRVRSGKTLKHNGEINPARYDFHYDYDKGPEDETVIRDIGNVFENPVHSAFTRSISLNLRHGVPVQYVCEQLLKGAEKDSDLYSFSRVMSRVLKNYIQDGTKTTQKKCPECNSSNLSYQQGCVTCLDCGSSKCG